MAKDILGAIRLLRTDRAFTLLATLALGLGIGVNSTFFSLVNAAVLRGLPIQTANDVMFLSLRDARNVPRGFTHAQYEDLRRGSRVLIGVGAYSAGSATIGDDDRPLLRVSTASVSSSAFPTLGVTPMLGRMFGTDDDRGSAPAAALIAHRLWQSRYGGTRTALGQTITLDGVPTTIVGVLPDRVEFPGATAVWTPLNSRAPSPITAETRLVSVFGRLAPGRTAEQAQAELESFRMLWARSAAGRLDSFRASAIPINYQFFGRVTDTVWLAFISAGVLVFLIACANVANLLMMRAAARDREVALRMSLGATRGRIIRQLLVESAVLAVTATVVGAGFALAGLRLLQSMVPAEVAHLFDFSFDARALALLVAVACASVLLSGVAPAFHVSRRSASDVLKDGGRSGGGAIARKRWATTFLAAEFALTLVLLANVAESVRTVRAASDAQVSIDPEPILTMSVTLPIQPYGTPEVRQAFFQRFVEAIASLPSVASVSLASVLPESGGPMRQVAFPARRPSSGDSDNARAVTILAGQRYFETLGLSLVAGRPFNDLEGTPGQEAAIVNERFTAMFLRGRQPVGELIRVAGSDGDTSSGPWLRIVGVAPSVRQSSEDGVLPDPVVYLPMRSAAPASISILVRTTGVPAQLTAAIRAALGELDRRLPLDRPMPLTQALRNVRWNPEIARVLLNSISTIALLLALVGLYAVTAHSVRLRAKELGIRLALGATQRTVRTLVLQRALAQLVIGLVVGVGVTFAFDRLFITGTSRLIDPVVLLPTMAAILLVGMTASLVPASRAARVDPAVALRED